MLWLQGPGPRLLLSIATRSDDVADAGEAAVRAGKKGGRAVKDAVKSAADAMTDVRPGNAAHAVLADTR